MSVLDYPKEDVLLSVHKQELKRDILRCARELDPRRAIERHPVATVTVAAGAGLILGQLTAIPKLLAWGAKTGGKFVMPAIVGWMQGRVSKSDEQVEEVKVAAHDAKHAAHQAKHVARERASASV